MATTEKRALVIGANGGVGGEVARALARHGWAVDALARGGPARGEGVPGVRWIVGDAMREADVVAAAAGARVIFHGANPPRYQKWRELAVPMLRNSVAAARASGARLLYPGTIYNFGPDAFPLLREGAPQRPLTRKGAVRAEMEAMLSDAAADGGVRSTVLRAGDFFGPRAPSTWFAQAVVKPGRPVRKVTWPGRRGVGHAWAYLPDLAEAFARLAEMEADLPAFESLHFAGHWVEDGEAMAAAVREAAGDPALPLRRFPWALTSVAAPFSAFLRELVELRYLWEQPLRLDDARLRARLGGEEPHTPLAAAVRETLAGLGCLPAPAAAAG
jgi:nucleoside-diphosphate-sugar epimerase